MKYSIKKVSKHDGMFWAVFEGKKQVGLYYFKDQAEDCVQRCIEDDAWNKANRD